MTLHRVSLLDTHWVQLGRGLKFSILNSHLGARMPQITQRIQTKSYCPFRQWLPFSVIRLRPSSGTAIIHTKTSERGVERWQTTSTELRTGSGLNQPNTTFSYWKNYLILYVGQIQDLRIWPLLWVGISFNWLHLKDAELEIDFTEPQFVTKHEQLYQILDTVCVWLEIFLSSKQIKNVPIQYHRNNIY